MGKGRERDTWSGSSLSSERRTMRLEVVIMDMAEGYIAAGG